MKRVLILALILLSILPSIYAINLKIEKISSDEVLIIGLDKPAIINLRITNRGVDDSFMFYTFFGSGMYPKGTVAINSWETKDVEIGIYPREDFKTRGYVSFDYFIKSLTGEQRETLILNIIELNEAFEIGSSEFHPEENSLEIYIKNKVNFNFEKLNVKFSSAFFDFEESFSLLPKEQKEFEVRINKEDFRKLMAGFYTLGAEVDIEGTKTNVEGIIKFTEKDVLKTTEKNYGLVITTHAIEKVNMGNTISESETTLKKNIISRLFTTFSPYPDFVERKGFVVYYTWVKELNPGETFQVSARTNWFFPLITILFIVAIVFFAKTYSRTNIVLKKKVSFVKAKGGEFALKVSISVQARKYVERISIMERLPPLVKLHEKFGIEKPKAIDEKNKKIEWYFEKLESGEIRILSYIIYSKVGVVGKFALPTATAIYEKDGKIQESSSNKAFFIAEQKMPREE